MFLQHGVAGRWSRVRSYLGLRDSARRESRWQSDISRDSFDMGLILDAILTLTGVVPWHPSDLERQRFREVRHAFLAVSDSLADAAFLAAIASVESAMNPGAIGPPIAGNVNARAYGLMQVRDIHFSRFGLEDNRWRDPIANLRAAKKLLQEQHEYGREPIREVLREYGGFVSVDPATYVNRVLRRFGYYLGAMGDE